ncbi:MAG: hypothetical protein ACRD1H_07700, partial [Vicinamibacterales bacterium]
MFAAGVASPTGVVVDIPGWSPLINLDYMRIPAGGTRQCRPLFTTRRTSSRLLPRIPGTRYALRRPLEFMDVRDEP